MALFPFFLTLLSAFLHAFWHLLARKNPNRDMLILLSFVGCLLLYFPACLYTWDAKLLTFPILSSVLLSTATEIGYLFLILKAYELGPLSVAYPIARGTSPVVVSLFTVFFLNEPLSAMSWAGIALVLLGIFFVSGFGSGVTHSFPIGRVTFLSILSGVNIGIYTLVDSRAVRTVPPLSYKYLTFIGITLFLFFKSKQKNNLKTWHGVLKRDFASVVILSFLLLFTYLLVLYVMQISHAAKVATLRETSSLLSVILGYFVLKEPLGWRKGIGAIFIVCGILLIKFS